MGNNLENTGIQWHSGFYGAVELELISDKEALEFHREYKSPDDSLSVDDFYKVMAYACLYKRYTDYCHKPPDEGKSPKPESPL